MTTPDVSNPAKTVFYFRTLDRWPGGNADMITVKAVLRLPSGAAPELEAEIYRCFDGRHTWYPARRIAFAPGDALPAFLAVARSLAARGLPSLTVRPFAPSDDEWEPDWAEAEVLFYASDDGPETPDAAALQLVRQVSRTQASPPEPELERAFELARQLIGIGRVFPFTEGQDALSAAYRAPGGPAPRDLEHTAEVTPSYLPPETDATFGRVQGVPQATQAARPESMLVYRLDELPEFLTGGLGSDASVRRCLFFTARADSRVIDALMEAVPEREHDDADAGMDIANRVSRIASQSEEFARTLRPDQVPAGGAIVGGTYAHGFHGGDAEAVEGWLAAQGVERVPLRTFFDRLILLRVLGNDGAPLEQIAKFAGGPPMSVKNSLGDGLYVFERDRHHTEFELSRDDADDAPGLKLRAEDLPPGVVHTVTIRA